MTLDDSNPVWPLYPAQLQVTLFSSKAVTPFVKCQQKDKFLEAISLSHLNYLIPAPRFESWNLKTFVNKRDIAPILKRYFLSDIINCITDIFACKDILFENIDIFVFN